MLDSAEGHLRGHNSTSFGVNCRSLLVDLKYFDLCSGALIPDIMHDLLEGVLQHETKLMLKHFIDDEHYFTCARLNECMRCLDLGYMEKCDRPTEITSDKLHSSDNLLKQKGIFIFLCEFLNRVFTEQLHKCGS